MSIEPLTDRPRGAGLRVTAARVTVLDVLDASRDHPRVDQIIPRVRRFGVSLSTQATYDVCDELHRAGLARRIELAGGPARFESRTGDYHHHHLVCRTCDATTDVDCAVGGTGCLEPSDTQGFMIEEAEVTFGGPDPACRQQTVQGSSA